MLRFRILPGLLALLPGIFVVGQDLRIAPLYLKDPQRIEVLVEPLRGSERSRLALGGKEGGTLTLLEDGQPTVAPQSFRTFQATDRGIAVVLALDVSGSMKGKPLDEMKKSLAAFAGIMGPKDRLALVSFADDIRVDAAFEAPRSELLKQIAEIQTRGRITELYKALFKCLSLFDTPGLPERKRLVILTDGKDEGAAYALDDALNRARERGIPVDAVGVTQIDPKYLSVCERLSDLTGGMYVNATRLEDMEGLLVQGAKALQASSVAVFTPAQLRPDGAEHRIGVRYQFADLRMEGEAKLTLPAGPPKPPDHRLRNWIIAGSSAMILLVVVVVLLVRSSKHRKEAAQREEELRAQPLPSLDSPVLQSEPEPVSAPATSRPATRLESPEAPPVEPTAPRRQGRKTVFQSEFRCAKPAPGQPAARLKADSGPCVGQVFGIETDPCWIGAEEEAAICLPGDSYVSGFHAYIRWQEDMLYLFDSRSTNGTFKNDQRLGETSVVLAPGDRIRVGQTVFEVLSA